MIEKVQCLLPARLQRHDNISPAKRIRPKCVSFLTNTVTILIHPHTWWVSQNVLLPTEQAEQIPLTPTASAPFDIKNTATFNHRAMDDNDEPWATEADHRTGWNTTSKSGTYRVMLYGIVLRDYQKQVVSMTKAKSVPINMREFLSWAHRHYRLDSTVERKTGGPTSAGTCQVDAKSCPTKVRTRTPSGKRARYVVPFERKNVIRSEKTQLHVLIATRTTGRATHTRERRIVSIVELTLILFRVRSSKLSGGTFGFVEA